MQTQQHSRMPAQTSPQLPPLVCKRATFRKRRRQAAKILQQRECGPLVLFARNGHDPASDWQTCVGRWRQDPWFAWLTGCNEDSAALILWPDGRTELFLLAGDPARVVWDGPRLAPTPRVAKHYGVDTCRPIQELKDALMDAAASAGGLLSMLWRKQEPGAQSSLAQSWRRRLRGITTTNVEPDLVHLRMVKDAEEIAWHEHAVAKTAAGLKAAWTGLPRFSHEGQVAGALLPHYLGETNDAPAFATIAGAGVNAATLHYPANNQPLADACCLLIDSGASAGGYAADVTRTWPLGTWTPRFQEIYELVLRTQIRAINLLRPGLTWSDWNAEAWQPIRDAGFTLHHGIGHHLGLDTHDPADRKRPFDVGMLLTVEPGIYLPEEGIGVRIEDNILLTKDGLLNTTAAIPKTVRQLTRK
jgi:Xaa-Pro aminopeptidase